jgi:hypothetical protein
MRVLYRFTKHGHVAEIREHIVTQFRAIELLIYVDGSALVSQLFRSGNEGDYLAVIATRIKELIDDGWSEERVSQLHP